MNTEKTENLGDQQDDGYTSMDRLDYLHHRLGPLGEAAEYLGEDIEAFVDVDLPDEFRNGPIGRAMREALRGFRIAAVELSTVTTALDEILSTAEDGGAAEIANSLKERSSDH